MKNKLIVSLKCAAFILFVPLLVLSCKTDLLGSSEQVVDAASPRFKLEPNSTKVGHNTPFSIKTKAVSVDGGTISYRWYSVKDAEKSEPKLMSDSAVETDSELNSVLTVSTETVGKFYYYAEACNTNTSRSVTGKTSAFIDSGTVCIEVVEDNIIKYFSNNEQEGSGYIFHQQKKTLNKDIRLIEKSDELKKTGYSFFKWNTEPNGSGDEYDWEDTYKENKDLNLYAQWVPITYNITLKDSPNPDRKIFAVFDKALPNLNPLPNKAGFNFGGCYVEHNGKKIAIYDKNGKGIYIWKIAEDKDCFPLYGYAIVYANTLDAENSNPAVYAGDVDVELKPLSLKGAAFKGWFASSDYSGTAVTKIAAGASGDKTFHAKWEFTNYELKYELNGGTNNPGNPSNFTIKDEINLNDPKKVGYDFKGWYDNASFGGKKIEKIEKHTAENIKLYAKWVRQGDWAITYVLSKGQTLSPPRNSTENPTGYNKESSDAARKLHNPEPRTGYAFEGWYDNEAFTGEKLEKIEKSKSGELTLYAKWKAEVYKLTLIDSDTENRIVDVSYDSPLPKISVPTKNGSYFSGYYEQKNGKGKEYYGGNGEGIGVWSIRENKTVYSAWKYIIEYKNVLDAVNPNPTLYDGTEEIVIKPLSLNGRIFGGWFTTENFSGDAVTKISVGETGKKVFYAKWTSIEYKIEYELNGGENSPNPAKYTVDDEIILKSPNKFGYELEGWYDNAGFAGITVEKIAKGSTGNKKIYAKWKIAQDWKINYVLHEGQTASVPVNSDANPKGYNITSSDMTLHNPNERKGYNFVGWYYRHITNMHTGTYTEEKITEIKTAELVSKRKGDITIYAKWNIITYNITYKLNGGHIDSTNVSTYTIEDEIILKPAYWDVNNHFISWNILSPTAQVIPMDKIKRGSTGDIELIAKWTTKNKITYYLNGGVFNTTPQVEYDNDAPPYELPTPVKLGCNFLGWYANPDLDGKKIIKICKTPDEANGVYSVSEVYAKWEKIKYKIEYELGGAKPDHGNPADYNVESETITLKDPVRPGAIFKGWYENNAYSGASVEKILSGSTGNKKFYAKWELIQYKIEYDVKGGNLPAGTSNPTIYTVGQSIKMPLPTKKDLVFAGWYDKDGKGWRKVEAATLGDNVGNKKLFARWVNLKTVETGAFKRTDENGAEHTITVSTFHISDHEVTQREFKAVMGDNPSHFKGNNLPVERLNWYHAVAYCNKLSIKEGLEPVYFIDGMDTERWKNLKFSDIPTDVDNAWEFIVMNRTNSGYRLPTEAEWEFAASGGKQTHNYEFAGSNTLDGVAWHKGNSENKTHEVKSKNPNELGLYDMSGNVIEWCWDRFAIDNYSSAGTCTDPAGPLGGIRNMRVIRGGSYYNEDSKYFKVKNHIGAKFTSTEENVGFRVVCSDFFSGK